MITGFNTDVEHDGVVYHVQTEDKGVKSPLILSLVYVGGTILASKRTRYDDLIASGFDEKTLAERLNRQHRLICAAIHTGRLEDLKRQTERDSATRAQVRESPKDERIETAGDAGLLDAPSAEFVGIVNQYATGPTDPPQQEAAPQEPNPEEAIAQEPAPLEDLSIFELGSIADNMPPAAFSPPPPVIDEPVAADEVPTTNVPSPPQEPLQPTAEIAPPAEAWGHVDYSRVVDYSTDAERNLRELHISLLDETKYVAGEFVKIQLHVGRGWDGHRSVVGAAVTLKVLGSSFRPMIFSGKTLADGTAIFYAMLPYFTSGRAAILISAADQGEKAELRRVIHQS
ncbi:MAG: hypothetical protein QOJ64_2821 [Acidobacteriota bacterium]|nr:hypothetical protein [Acidobacteriota bacterium]